ncbi:hypothetical protein ACSBR2_003914 [Camellia fascicularis]
MLECPPHPPKKKKIRHTHIPTHVESKTFTIFTSSNSHILTGSFWSYLKLKREHRGQLIDQEDKTPWF